VNSLVFSNFAGAYLPLNQVDEAEAAAREALASSLDSSDLRFHLYQLAFLKNDVSGMAKQVAWAAGKPGVEDLFLYGEASTAAYFGLLTKAREFSRAAVTSAGRADEKEVAATYEADAAVREALFGNAAEAKNRVIKAFALSHGRDMQFAAALASAIAQDNARAEQLAADLAKRLPEDTVVNGNYLPAVHAWLGLHRKDPSGALEALRSSSSYEFALPYSTATFALHPVYARGQAYLAGDQGREAAVEFQKIVDHRGIVVNEAIGALAASWSRPRLRVAGRHPQSPRRLSGFPRALEGRRP